MKAFITSLQQQKPNQITSLLQCNTFKLSTSFLCVQFSFESLHAISVPFKGKKSANLCKHVRRIRNCNSRCVKKVRRYVFIFLQKLKSLQPTVSRGDSE